MAHSESNSSLVSQGLAGLWRPEVLNQGTQLKYVSSCLIPTGNVHKYWHPPPEHWLPPGQLLFYYSAPSHCCSGQAQLEQSPKGANQLHHDEICLFTELEPWIDIFRLQGKHHQYKGKLLFQRSCFTQSPCTALEALKGTKHSQPPSNGKISSSWRPSVGRNAFYSHVNRFSWKIFHFANMKWPQDEKTHVRPRNPKKSLPISPEEHSANHWWRHLLLVQQALPGSSPCNLPRQGSNRNNKSELLFNLVFALFRRKTESLGFLAWKLQIIPWNWTAGCLLTAPGFPEGS